MSEPEDRRREDGEEGRGPGAVPPWDPSRASGPDAPAPRPSTGGWQSPGGPVPPTTPTPSPGPPSGSQQSGPQQWGPPPSQHQPGPQNRPGDPWGFGGSLAAPRPGIVPLRPLALGELLDGAYQYIRAHPRVVLGISAVIAVITVLIQSPFQASFGTSLEGLVGTGGGSRTVNLSQLGGLVGGAVWLAGVGLLVSLLANTVLTGLLIVVLSRSVLGAAVDARQVWDAARPRLPGLLGVVVLVALITVVTFLVPLIPAGVLGLLRAPTGATAGLALLGIVVGAVLAVIVAVGLALAAPAYVLEGISVTTALRRSRDLVRGRFWPVLGILLLTAIIVTIVAGIIGIPFGVIASAAGNAVGEPSAYAPLPLLISSIGTVIGAALTSPFQAGVTGLLYIDQRMRREGFDIELQRAAREQG
ncbi:glycerophosphoryl diester phosphodiesterase membrane domain-containing protein [Actinomycetospora endophytica]|uniref:Glycerophosphoryl diester phosphodiesterase membrane domain-containing protein n=1 Tax=Actinomycetospora endophytica TaxID=2291215 RepID=A0ABS8PAQ9_9PSEU|nr:glycerophosphoryl diester phosphodiesterase membrane domain-containing protein [Actinomycetospora endophytica]MCD2195022.1 glycerophosphoryl diester phosphodiesterase membrane domain-containing protein [Actinomycetospora endophytica]